MYRMFNILSMCLLALMGFSCPPRRDSQESYHLEAFRDEPKVFYGETGDPCESDSGSTRCESLSAEELAQILSLVSAKTQESLWFVRVPLSSSRSYRNQVWAYLAPDVANTRLRSGLAYTIVGLGASHAEPHVSSPWPYVQVSLPGKLFGRSLDTPHVCDLPFPYPSRHTSGSARGQDLLSKEELVKIMDYVRDPCLYLEFEDRKEISVERLPSGFIRSRHRVLFPGREKMAEIVVSQPVVDVRTGVGEVTVTFGFVHNGLFAHCYSVKLRVTGERYELTKWSFVIS